MTFRRYQHIERFGTTEVQNIELGECYIFPKIDGTNAQLWYDKSIKAGSRNRELTLDNDNAGFYNWAVKQENFIKFFNKYPNLRLFGEWLVPHTLKTYDESAWRKFYVFDVMDFGAYVNYEDYKIILEDFNINYIPPICKIKNPTYEGLVKLLEKNTYLIKDGEGSGEGIVIKNYDYENQYGRTTWAKIVKNEFKSSFLKNKVTDMKDKKQVEYEIVMKYVTSALIEKEYSKINNEVGWNSKLIPRLLQTVYYCLIKEESWSFVKEFKNPKIDFNRINQLTIQRIKELKPEIF